MRRGLSLVRRQIYVESPAVTRPSTCRWSSTVRWPVLPVRSSSRAANRCSIRSTYLRGPCTTEDCKFFSKRRARIRSAAVSTGCASSPKRQQPPLDEAFRRAHELKVIVEREDDLQWAEQNAARVGDDCLLYLQPEWSVYERMMPLLVEYAKAHPQWNISIQTHKFMHIP